jgi:hypothetical protein
MIKKPVFLLALVLALLALTGCFRTIPADPAADPAFCGAPCDDDLGIGCSDGFACVSGVCLNSVVCGTCGTSCYTDDECGEGYHCGVAAGAPSGALKECWGPLDPAAPNAKPYQSCYQTTETYCGQPCEFPDVLGGYTCFNGVMVAHDRNLCSTCGKDCKSNADCSAGVACVQFPGSNGGSSGFCWDEEVCTSDPFVSIDTGNIPQLAPTKTPTPTAAPTVKPANINPQLPTALPGLCDDHGGVANVSEVCTCQSLVDRVTFCGDGTKIDTITDTQCSPDPSQCQPSDTGGTSGGSGGECRCVIVCTQTNEAGACIDRGYRDCNGNVCTP